MAFKNTAVKTNLCLQSPTSGPCTALPGFSLSKGVTLQVTGVKQTSFTGTSKHSSGITTWNYDSTQGCITN